ncbi:MAG: hypothetical protein R3C09_26960 [Pirellulaceae bacterium]
MRWFAWTLMLAIATSVGCNQPVETIPAVSPAGSSSGTTADGDHADHDHAEGEGHDHDADGEPSAANEKAEVIRFVADKRISVPEMMCPYSCWPAVQETLAAQPGVESVQLAKQPDGTAEGEIKERVVELKLNGDFDADAAIAALAKANYEAELAQ